MTCLGAAGGGVLWKSGLGWRAEVQEQEQEAGAALVGLGRAAHRKRFAGRDRSAEPAGRGCDRRVGRTADGLMVHIGYLGGDGFVIQDVWRTEAEMRSFDDSIFLPALTAVGVTMRSRRSFRSGRSHARDSGPDAVAK